MLRWVTRPCGVFFAFAACLGPAVAQDTPQGGAALSFETQEANGSGGFAALTLPGLLWGPPPDSSKGVVVLVHGSGGLRDHPIGHYARAFAEAGFTSYTFDAFGPRGVSSTVENQSSVSGPQMARDALNARRMLIARGYNPRKFAVMGFSKGGYAALLTADRTFLPDEKERFEAALPWYPACMAHPRNPKPASKVLIGIGDKDDYVAVKPCEDLAAAYRAAGGDMQMKVYPGAPHGFDGHPNNTRMFRMSTAENFRECVWVVEDDLKVTFNGKTVVNDMAFDKLLRDSCMRKGASAWTDQRQKAAATADAIAFVASVLAQ